MNCVSGVCEDWVLNSVMYLWIVWITDVLTVRGKKSKVMARYLVSDSVCCGI